MFGFGMTFCVLCDHRVPRGQARQLNDRDDVAVCNACQENWQHSGAICGRCKTPVVGQNDLGIFLDRYALGHLQCGGARLASAPDAARQSSRVGLAALLPRALGKSLSITKK